MPKLRRSPGADVTGSIDETGRITCSSAASASSLSSRCRSAADSSATSGLHAGHQCRHRAGHHPRRPGRPGVRTRGPRHGEPHPVPAAAPREVNPDAFPPAPAAARPDPRRGPVHRLLPGSARLGRPDQSGPRQRHVRGAQGRTDAGLPRGLPPRRPRRHARAGRGADPRGHAGAGAAAAGRGAARGTGHHAPRPVELTGAPPDSPGPTVLPGPFTTRPTGRPDFLARSA